MLKPASHFTDLMVWQKALVFVREMGAINNSAYRDINQMETLIASGHLRRLRELGLLEQKGKSSATYYVPTQRLLSGSMPPSSRGPGKQNAATELTAQSQGLTPSVTALSRGLTPSIEAQSAELSLPTDLARSVASLKRRSGRQEICDLILSLCSWQALRAEQLAGLLGRGQAYLTHTFLGPMVRDRQLEYTFPDNPAHPQQAYRTRKRA